MNDTPRPVALIVDVADGGRHDPSFEDELNELTASVVAEAARLGLEVDRVAAAQAGADELVRRLDAADIVVVMGGEDVDPSFYGQDRDPHLGQTFPEADRAQIALVRRAVETRTPTVGICRGMQIANVALGGDLIQHIDDGSHVGAGVAAESFTDHPVRLDPSSGLAGLLGATEVDVRSSHHQAVDRTGVGLRVVGTAADGTVEAVEHESAPLWCVQWHPEDSGSKGTVLRDLLRGALGAAGTA